MFEIGRVIESPNKDFKGIEGLELLLFNSSEKFPKTINKRLIISPMTEEGFEIYYKNAFETMGREWISNDYKYFLKYMLDEHCELISHIQISDLENVREAKKEDMREYEKAFISFVKKHDLDLKVESEG